MAVCEVENGEATIGDQPAFPFHKAFIIRTTMLTCHQLVGKLITKPAVPIDQTPRRYRTYSAPSYFVGWAESANPAIRN